MYIPVKMKDHHRLLTIGVIIGFIGFLLVISALCIEVEIYNKQLDSNTNKYTRILLTIIGEIFVFIGFAFINGSVIYKLGGLNF